MTNNSQTQVQVGFEPITQRSAVLGSNHYTIEVHTILKLSDNWVQIPPSTEVEQR